MTPDKIDALCTSACRFDERVLTPASTEVIDPAIVEHVMSCPICYPQFTLWLETGEDSFSSEKRSTNQHAESLTALLARTMKEDSDEDIAALAGVLLAAFRTTAPAVAVLAPRAAGGASLDVAEWCVPLTRFLPATSLETEFAWTGGMLHILVGSEPGALYGVSALGAGRRRSGPPVEMGTPIRVTLSADSAETSVVLTATYPQAFFDEFDPPQHAPLRIIVSPQRDPKC